MRVLALDTTTRTGSVAIAVDDRVIVAERGDPSRSHAERLPGDVIHALAAAALDAADIDVGAVAAGPGSFTGLRIGIATIQGLALVHRARVVAVSALAALAEAGSEAVPAGGIVGAWMDAHRGDVFSALYRIGGGSAGAVDRLHELEGPSVGTPAATWSRWHALGVSPAVVVGDGAALYRQIAGETAKVLEPPDLAPWIARMALARAHAGDTIGPAAIQPLYVRRPDAEVLRDARSAS